MVKIAHFSIKMTELTALLGIHDGAVLETYDYALTSSHFSVTKAATPEEMIRLAEPNQHYAYIMDLNFGKPGSSDITPALSVYNQVRSRVEAGEAKFVGISGNPTTVEAAKQQGIPAYYKTDFSIAEFAKQVHKS